jgi:hypothetical protein
MTPSYPELSAFLGYIPLLKWYNKKKTLKNSRLCAFAAAGGQLETLIWLRTKSLNIEKTIKVGKWKKMEIIQTMSESCNWDKMTIFSALKNRHHHIILWIINNPDGQSLEWSGFECLEAAKQGYVDILEYLRKKRKLLYNERLCSETKQLPEVQEWIHRWCPNRCNCLNNSFVTT